MERWLATLLGALALPPWLDTAIHHPDLLKYVSIPFVAGFVGWSTNWAAIELTFKPLRFVGWRPWLGWQGIIPSKAEKMASIFVDSTMSRLGTLPELFEQMEPDVISRQIVRVMAPRMERYADRLMLEADPELWRRTPQVIKEGIYQRLRDRLPDLVEALMDEANERVEELIDFKHMISTRLVEDPALLNRLFIDSGAEEFRFLVRSGLYFGFLFGLGQLTVWVFYPAPWVLPAFGVLVGYVTNWIAINLIFRPLHPKRIGPWTLQGLFLKRQKEVAVIWCALVTRHIVTVRALAYAMLFGPSSQNTAELVRRHLEPIVLEGAGPLLLPAQLAVGQDALDDLMRRTGDLSVEVSREPFDDWHFNRERATVVERLLRQRMEALSSEEFQDLLRPCFQEDELKLILVGAVLGGLAGLGQLLFVFGGG